MKRVQAVNLLSPTRVAARQRRRRVTRWTAGLVIYALALAGVWIATEIGGSGADRTLAAELGDARDQIERTQQRLDELTPQLAEARVMLAASEAVGNQPNWSLLLGLLSSLLDDSTVLSEFTLEPAASGWPGGARSSRRSGAEQTARGPYRLQLAGFGRSQAAVQAYVLRLERTGLFERVTLMDTRTEPFRDVQAVSFRIECHLGRLPESVEEFETDAGGLPVTEMLPGPQTSGPGPEPDAPLR